MGHAAAAAETDDYGFVDPPPTSAAVELWKYGGQGRRASAVSLMNFDSKVILLLVPCDVRVASHATKFVSGGRAIQNDSSDRGGSRQHSVNSRRLSHRMKNGKKWLPIIVLIKAP